jgi:hypothetical protein
MVNPGNVELENLTIRQDALRALAVPLDITGRSLLCCVVPYRDMPLSLSLSPWHSIPPGPLRCTLLRGGVRVSSPIFL